MKPLPVKTISGILEGVFGVVRVELVVLGYCNCCEGDVLKYPGSGVNSCGQLSSVCTIKTLKKFNFHLKI